ncbi:asparagine synthetase B (glutamine-hydrolyzing) [Kordia sp. SMS9]|uniref:asparagine synthase-related protein n=1 Tax=Kordia sp. SMS9 TaxID=2282170 RepID=UPI000E0D0D87|nr:asparagine synthase-related protein [Kordia sp. SMS9]AXG70812.1 asparagine synthetase B (glutamine-hydrolyzing) [Kordia sp. SMS9]
MCGIVLTISAKDAAECKQILNAQQHRGHDHQGIVTFENMHIGFNRLAIVDATAMGNQPFETADYITVFNGEIYNHETLRETYQMTTKGTSDIEIIAPLFEILGETIIDVLDGFYSGIIIHKPTKTCYVLRDYIGKKPLFFIKTTAFNCIASELKGVETIKSFEPIPKGISVIKGHQIIGIRSHQHKLLSKEKLKKVLEKAVYKRIPPHKVPFGVFISGGLDSAIIAAIIAKHSNLARYYCLGDENNEDYRHVQLLAKALQIQDKITYIPLPTVNTIATLIPKIVYHTESYNPSIISNGLATYLLAQQAAKDGLKVVLSGEGADELFCGYAITKDSNEWFAARNTLIQNLHFTELRRLDLTSMATTIEARCPFLDRDVYAIAIQLVKDELIHETSKLQGKYILRQLFKNSIPDRIINRKKMSCDVGSGIRKAVVEFSTAHGQTENVHLQTIWKRFFPALEAAHPYFSSYPIFDPFIAHRKAIHKDTGIIQRIEQMLLTDYQQTAFHNLIMQTKRTSDTLWLGGTCSDKTLHFKTVLAAEGIQTQLHIAEINGKLSHRLLSVRLLGKLYFIDVGSGWPCIQLFPAFADSSYEAFGIHFCAKRIKDRLVVTIKTSTVFKPLMEIPLQQQSQTSIKEAIANRFHPSKDYPLLHSLRLSFVKDHQFFFLKGNRLRVYEANKIFTEQQLTSKDISALINTYFPQLLPYHNNTTFSK